MREGGQQDGRLARAARVLPRRPRHAWHDRVPRPEGNRLAEAGRDRGGVRGLGRGRQRRRAAREDLGLPRRRHRRRPREMRVRYARARLRRLRRLQGGQPVSRSAGRLPEGRRCVLRQRRRRDPRHDAAAHEPFGAHRRLRHDRRLQRGPAVCGEEPALRAHQPHQDAGHDRVRLEGALRRGAQGARRILRAGQAQVPRVDRRGPGERAQGPHRAPSRPELRQAAGEAGLKGAMPGYVGFWQRSAAFLIDWLVVFVVYGPLVIMAFGSEYFSLEEPRYWDAATGLVIAAGTLLFWPEQGATPGKMAIAARIVDAQTGSSPGTARLVVRLFAYIVSALPLGLGFLWIAFDRRKQGWHDKIAGTVVIPDDE